jgi:hypothetical protein
MSLVTTETASTTVPLNWKGVFQTNCPMVSASDIDLPRFATRFSIRVGVKVAIVLALVFAGILLAHGDVPSFVERPGIVEFSGQMIVRPVQRTALSLGGQDIRVARARAAARLMPQAIEYISQTDEYIVVLPAGETENSYAARLMATGDYEYVVPNWICHPTRVPNDGDYWQQWHHPKVRSPYVWDISIGNPGVIVADVDGGVQLDHPDLVGALVPGYNSRDRLAQRDGGDVSDVDGHGTFVIGLAGAVGNNHINVVGMGWQLSIMPVRYYNSPGGGYLGDILDGVRWAVDHGVKCVNVSQTGVEYSPVQTTGAYVTSQGGLLFWAAGNDGRNLSWFDWDDVIVVGATDPNDARATFSAYGRAVDVFAPGTNIYSTGLGGYLAIGSGTSAATPIAAGIAALVWSVHPTMTPAEVRARLFSGCVDLGPPGHDDTWGWGRVDSYATVSGFSFFSGCMTGPDVPYGGNCGYTDSDMDRDVDLTDFASFQTAYGQ